MPIPSLDDDGLLPEGLHECTIDEVAEHFGRFTISDRRVQLVRRLREYCAELKGVAHLVEFIVVDGSFVTAKDEPNDIDILLALSPSATNGADFRPYEYNAVSKKRVRSRYDFDVLSAGVNTDSFRSHLAFFSQLREHADRRKGLLKVKP